VPPARQHVALKLSPSQLRAVSESATHYADAEAKASAADKAKLAALRAQLASEHKNIAIGITGVFGLDLHTITGASLHQPSAKEVEENRARRLADPNRANLLRRVGAPNAIRPGNHPVEPAEPPRQGRQAT
jgi:hypothetical protein